MLTRLMMKIPLWTKTASMFVVRNMGRMPLRILWQQIRYIYAESKRLPAEQRGKLLQKKHSVLLRYLKKKYGAFLTDQSAQYTDGTKNENFPIWVLWWQGEEKEPDIVKKCISTIRENANGHPVHIVTSRNYHEFLRLDPNVIDKMNRGLISLTHFSDIIRMNLLAEHGGFWMDSTIFCTKKIEGPEFDKPIFTLRNPSVDTDNVSAWEWTGFAIYGWQGGKLFCLMRDFFNRYWQDHNCLIDYFLIDYGIRLICDLCPDIQEKIDEIPVNNQNLYYFQQHFFDPHPGSLSELDIVDTWLFKLTWKQSYPMLTQKGEKTLYAAWCEAVAGGRVAVKTVSVVIPVYNVAAYLRQCLDTLIAQTYPHLQIILIDDGSPDESGSICDEYARRDSRIEVVHQENAGAANAKNTGLDRATGDYIAFLDSDDYVEPNWIERLITTAETYGADIVECDFDRVYRNHTQIANHYSGPSVYTAEEYLAQYVSNWTSSLFWSKLFRKELLTNVRFRKERRCIDDEFFTYKTFAGAAKVVRITDVLYHYRQRASSAMFSEKNRLQITDDSLEVLIERYQWISKHFPALRKLYLNHDVEVMFYFGKRYAFTGKTSKKLRKIARYYLKESILQRSGKLTFYYALCLQTIPLGQNPESTADAQVKADEYFA